MIERKCVGEKCYSFKEGKCYIYLKEEPKEIKEGDSCLIIEFAE